MRSSHPSWCPSGPVLQKLISGQLDAAESDTIENHLEDCVSCRNRLDQMSDSDLLDEWRSSIRESRDRFPFLDTARRPDDLGAIDHYAIESVIGRGGSGIVFRAWDMELCRPVAVKVLVCDWHNRATERFLRESQSAARTAGEYVVTVYSTGTTSDNRPYLVMPLIDGESLRRRLQRELPKPEEAARLIRDAAEGLAAVHAAGSIHRDVKTANILVEFGSGKARITDFGMARAPDDESLTQGNLLCGTPEYMSPEQGISSGELREASDIYSLGISLYECLTGTTPFRGRPLQILEQHRQTLPIRPSVLNPSTPRDLETICLKAISKSPALRYPSAAAMAGDLQRYLEGRPILARPSTSLERGMMWCSRNPRMATLTAISAGLLLLLAIGSTLFSIQLSRAKASIVEKQRGIEAAEEKARQDRMAAIESLDRLVDSLYIDLTRNAASIRTREKIVESAIAGLASLTQIEGDNASSRTAQKAHYRIADLYSLQGSTAKAEQAFHTSNKLARLLVSENPDDPDAKRELAKSLALSAIHFARYTRFEPMLEAVNEASQILKQLLNENPQDLSALRQLVSLHSRSMDYHWLNSPPEETLKLTRSAIDDVNRLLELETDNSENYRIANELHSRLGRAWLESGNLKQAELELDLARARIDRAAEISENEPGIQLQSAITSRMRGVLLNTLGKQHESLKSFARALQEFRTLAEAEPQDFTLQQNVANTIVLMVLPETALGKIDDAISSSENAIKAYCHAMQLTDQKTNTRSLLVQAHIRLASLYERKFCSREALLHCETALKIIDGDAANPALPRSETELSRLSAEVGFKSHSFMLDEATILETPAEIAATLLLVARMEAALTTNDLLSESARDRLTSIIPDQEINSFAELVDYIGSRMEEITEYKMTKDFLLARIWTLRGKKLDDSLAAGGFDEIAGGQMSVTDCANRAMEHLETFVGEFPSVAFEIRREPDLIWLRNSPGFQNSVLAVACDDKP